jgi:hypothetical protein
LSNLQVLEDEAARVLQVVEEPARRGDQQVHLFDQWSNAALVKRWSNAGK